MKIQLICVGRTRRDAIGQAFEEYSGRVGHYFPYAVTVIPDVKLARSATAEQQKLAEGRLILEAIGRGDYVLLLDERGRGYTSRDFAAMLERRAATGVARIDFVIGGPYGFSSEVYDRADGLITLSQMTLPHDMARLMFAEQLYRAGTILRGEPYHHD